MARSKIENINNVRCWCRAAEKQWANIGRGAARMGLPVENVLTKSELINKLIRDGYERAVKRKERTQQ